MNKWQSMVQRFHREVVKQPCSPAEPMLRMNDLRANLVLEEAIETVVGLVGSDEAYAMLKGAVRKAQEHASGYGEVIEPNLVEAIDGCLDTIVVCLGTLETIGVDGDPFMDEIMRSNMAKAGGPMRADGKMLKPPGWTPPDIEGVLGRMRFDWFMNEVKRRVAAGLIAPEQQAMSREQRISFVYGNLAMENPNVTREMVERAVDEADAKKVAP